MDRPEATNQDERSLDVLVVELVEQMLDAVEARALLVHRLHHPPRRFGNVRALEHHFLGPRVVLPAAP